ncbi:MAG: hypothetical protein ACK4S4_04165 [Pyrinomonadaceae bacterium]
MKLRFGIIAGIFLAVFSLYPQMKLIYVRGGEWQGNYAYNDIDEVAYASYVKALIDGRPRRNDPYTGRDHSPEHPQPESLFSIQFAAPYTLALPARFFGISAPWAMTIAGAVAAFLAAVAVFWLLFQLTGSNWYAMAGSLVTLAGGAVFAGEGAASEIFFDGFSYPYFPGFRRYIPAVAMPVFFAFVGAVWKLLPRAGDEGRERRPWPTIAAAAVMFGYVVFSYFYIWTTAAAWLACLSLLLLAVRPDGYRQWLRSILLAAAAMSSFLIAYALLLAARSHTMDDVQLLVRTHAPDLARVPEYVAFFVLLMIAAGVATRRIELRDRATVFVASLALAVFAVFNQQVVTGHSLQPIHYQVFIGNYVAGLALVAATGLLLRDARFAKLRAANLAFAGLAAVAVTWGFIECHYTVRVLDDVNLLRDQQMPLARRLTELAAHDAAPHRSVVYHLGVAEADDLPTIAPQATLWARHQHVFAGVTWQENKERYYQYLYFQGVSEEQLASSMKSGDFVSMIALFGWGRHTDRLNSEFRPLTYGEIDEEARSYGRYIAAFDPLDSPETIISYVVVPDYTDVDLRNLDHWYERDEGERLGPFTLYKVRLRGAEPSGRDDL